MALFGRIAIAIKRRLSGRLCCKSLFGPLNTIFPGYRRGDRIIMWGTTSTGAELTGNFGGALEDISIGDYRLVRLLAEN